MEKLKSCPFCGQHPDLDFHRNGCKRFFLDDGNAWNTGNLYTVKCRWCDTGIGAYESPEGAIRAWNRRADDGLSKQMEDDSK